MSYIKPGFYEDYERSDDSAIESNTEGHSSGESSSDELEDKGEDISSYTYSSPTGWQDLPSLLLEQIFNYLNVREKYVCSLVCKSWYLSFRCPRLWRHLCMREKSFIKSRYSLQYRRYEKVISQTQIQLYLGKVGHHLRRVSVLPIEDYYNLSEFIKVLGAFLRFFEDYPVKHLKWFDFSFACEIRSGSESMVFGTGGQLLAEIKTLLTSLKGIIRLKINDLLLDSREAPDLLAGFTSHNRESLQHLEVLNVCKVFMPHFYVSTFPNLRTLVISPSQISDEIIVMFGTHQHLSELILIQNKYTCDCEPVSSNAWRQLRQKNHEIRVQLEVRGPVKKEILIQPDAPVHTILIKTPFTKLEPGHTLQILDNYHNTLRVFGQLGLPKTHGSRSFDQRCDTYLVMLVNGCPKLEKLILRERISTTTLLIIASSAGQLKELLVRQNAMIKKFDWPKLPRWSNSFYLWMKKTAKCEELVEVEISRIFGAKWKMLSDKWFKSIQL